MNNVYTHKGKSRVAGKLQVTGKVHMTKTCFSTEAYKQTATASYNEYSEVNSLLSAAPGRAMKTHSKNKSMF